jgi:hypothetical protein
LANARREYLTESLGSYRLAHALGAMAREGMGDFVAHDNGDAVVILRHRHYAFPKRDLPAGQRKCVNIFAADYIELPFVVGFIGRGGDSLSDAFELCLPIGPGGKLLLFQRLLLGVFAEL